MAEEEHMEDLMALRGDAPGEREEILGAENQQETLAGNLWLS